MGSLNMVHCVFVFAGPFSVAPLLASNNVLGTLIASVFACLYVNILNNYLRVGSITSLLLYIIIFGVLNLHNAPLNQAKAFKNFQKMFFLLWLDNKAHLVCSVTSLSCLLDDLNH